MPSPTETSPLLAAPADAVPEEAAVSQLEPSDPIPPRIATLLRSIKILQILLFTSSITNFAVAIATYVVFKAVPFYHNWYWEDGFLPFWLGTFLAALFSTVILRWQAPYLINLFANLGIPFYLFVCCSELGRYWPQQYWCPEIGTNLLYGDSTSRADCLKLLSVFQGLLFVCIGFTVIVMIFHLALIVLRTVVLLRQRAAPSSSQLSLWLPTGEITLSVTIRVLKQRSGMENPRGGAAVIIEQGTLPEGE